MAVLIPADDVQLLRTPANGAAFSLEEMQQALGGYIEYVTPPLLGHHLIVNEEGLLLQLPFNALASQIAGRTLVGPALFCTCAEAGCEEGAG